MFGLFRHLGRSAVWPSLRSSLSVVRYGSDLSNNPNWFRAQRFYEKAQAEFRAGRVHDALASVDRALGHGDKVEWFGPSGDMASLIELKLEIQSTIDGAGEQSIHAPKFGK